MTTRKVPVHRPSGGGANRAARRAASHPGTGSGSANGDSGFISPFQPPPGQHDLGGDIARLSAGEWQAVVVGDLVWRARPGSSRQIGDLVEALESEGSARILAMARYLIEHMERDDLVRLLLRLMDEDDTVVTTEYFYKLWRAIVTVGTARPFLPSPHLLGRLHITGDSCGPSSLWQGYRNR